MIGSLSEIVSSQSPASFFKTAYETGKRHESEIKKFSGKLSVFSAKVKLLLFMPPLSAINN